MWKLLMIVFFLLIAIMHCTSTIIIILYIQAPHVTSSYLSWYASTTQSYTASTTVRVKVTIASGMSILSDFPLIMSSLPQCLSIDCHMSLLCENIIKVLDVSGRCNQLKDNKYTFCCWLAFEKFTQDISDNKLSIGSFSLMLPPRYQPIHESRAFKRYIESPNWLISWRKSYDSDCF